MDGHQFRGARIYRDMMLVSIVCVVGLSVVSGGVSKYFPRFWEACLKSFGKERKKKLLLLIRSWCAHHHHHHKVFARPF